MYLEIEKVIGREILDSRGNPTVEAEVYLIDPKPVDVHSTRRIHIIQKGASEGVQELRSLLKS